MNRRFVLIILIGICSALYLLFFHGNDYTELVFSMDSGFYDEPFKLELYSPIGTEIYYTLDGSEPDTNAILYTEPITIDDASLHDNVCCMRMEVVQDSLHKSYAATISGYKPLYTAPDYLIDKCTIVRAAYKDADGNFSETKSESYFVNYGEKAGYDGINIISIVTDQDNLFDADTGIYVFPNYSLEGMESERNASVQLFNADKKLFLNQDCGIRIQGGASRARLPKSFNLYAREQYSDTGRFYTDLFGTDYIADTVTLTVSGEDSMSKCRDTIISRLTSERNFVTMNYEPYVMFLDGEYWGFYWLTEKYDDLYFQHYYGTDADNAILIKARTLAEGEESDYTLYTEMIDYMTDTDLSIPDNYEHACDLIDMQSYIDYFAAQIYLGHNSDWPGYNEALWRVRQPREGKYNDGKWRWVLYDVNSALYSPEFDTLSYAMNYSAMFHNLCQNEEFKKQFATTLMDYANTIFTKENVTPVISECVQQMEEPMGVHLKRFFSFEDNSWFLEETSYIQYFFDNRKPYITQYLKDDFGLNGSLAPVTIEINDNAAGSIIINTAALTFDNSHRWVGEYYTDYPITLTAVANDGYRFVRWESGSSTLPVSGQSDIEIELNADGTYMKAVFTKTDDSADVPFTSQPNP